MTTLAEIAETFIGQTVTSLEAVEVNGGDEIWVECNDQVLVVGYTKRGGMYIKHCAIRPEIVH